MSRKYRRGTVEVTADVDVWMVMEQLSVEDLREELEARGESLLPEVKIDVVETLRCAWEAMERGDHIILRRCLATLIAHLDPKEVKSAAEQWKLLTEGKHPLLKLEKH